MIDVAVMRAAASSEVGSNCNCEELLVCGVEVCACAVGEIESNAITA